MLAKSIAPGSLRQRSQSFHNDLAYFPVVGFGCALSLTGHCTRRNRRLQGIKPRESASYSSGRHRLLSSADPLPVALQPLLPLSGPLLVGLIVGQDLGFDIFAPGSAGSYARSRGRLSGAEQLYDQPNEQNRHQKAH